MRLAPMSARCSGGISYPAASTSSIAPCLPSFCPTPSKHEHRILNRLPGDGLRGSIWRTMRYSIFSQRCWKHPVFSPDSDCRTSPADQPPPPRSPGVLDLGPQPVPLARRDLQGALQFGQPVLAADGAFLGLLGLLAGLEGIPDQPVALGLRDD